jgi:hypothetical protein
MSRVVDMPDYFKFQYDYSMAQEMKEDGVADTGLTDGFGDNDRLEEDIYVGEGEDKEERGKEGCFVSPVDFDSHYLLKKLKEGHSPASYWQNH